MGLAHAGVLDLAKLCGVRVDEVRAGKMCKCTNDLLTAFLQLRA